MVRLGNMFSLQFELPGLRLVSTSEVVDRQGTYFGAELQAFRLQCHFYIIFWPPIDVCLRWKFLIVSINPDKLCMENTFMYHNPVHLFLALFVSRKCFLQTQFTLPTNRKTWQQENKKSIFSYCLIC